MLFAIKKTCGGPTNCEICFMYEKGSNKHVFCRNAGLKCSLPCKGCRERDYTNIIHTIDTIVGLPDSYEDNYLFE